MKSCLEIPSAIAMSDAYFSARLFTYTKSRLMVRLNTVYNFTVTDSDISHSSVT